MRRPSLLVNLRESQMLGQHREDLAKFALTQAEKLIHLREERQNNENKFRNLQNQANEAQYLHYLKKCFQVGGDLLFFSTLAITLALLSFSLDILVRKFFGFRSYLTTQLSDSFLVNYTLWVAFTLGMVLVAALITDILSPQAGGSGIPEIKVILRGVVLKEYLTFKTLTAKIVGLVFTLGSGLPLGKEGPFVHLSSITAKHFMRLFGHLSSSREEYESRFQEVLAVACSVGVAVTFASPVGGVLFSIEIVSVFFSLRSYWSGFFAATFGALFWRLLSVWFEYQGSITHVFKTNFRLENPYENMELLTFALLGVLCGLAAYLFIQINSCVIKNLQKANKVNEFFKKYPVAYAGLVSLIVALLSFPGTFGQFYASWLNTEESIHQLFSNFTWSSKRQNHTLEQLEIIQNWQSENTSFFLHLFLFTLMNILVVAVGVTLPIPLGLIGPSLKIGAGLGRFYGEGITYLFPDGISPFNGINRTLYPILPGTYAVVGCAAFAGANTGAMSTAVMAFEMTGQVTHLLPLIVAILAATLTATLLGPSIYDSLIQLKQLPYLPPTLPSSSKGNHILVEHFMERQLTYVWQRKMTYRYIRYLLIQNQNRKIRIFPFVRSPKNKILLGTIEREELVSLLDRHLNRQKIVGQLRRSMANIGAFSENSENSQTFEQNSVESISWEERQLDFEVDFSQCAIDPAPFQLVEGTSLPKVHHFFTLLGLQVAYVTSLGTLVGVVSLKEVRKGIEEMNAGTLPRSRLKETRQEAEINNQEEKEEKAHMSNSESLTP